MARLILGLLVCLAVAHHAPAQTTARAEPVRGRVVDAGNGAPLRRARITVLSAESPVDTAFTDNDGRFAIAGLPATSLTVRAKKAGYVAAAVSLPAGGRGTEIGFSLPKSAAVMGRVVDSNRAPVNGAFVIGRLLLPDGRKAPDRAGRFYAASDALGDYRLGGLPAGRYEITAARVPPEYREPGMAIEDQLFGPAEKLDLASGAATVTLAAGDDAHDLDFTIPDVEERCLAASLVPSLDAGDGAASISGRVTAASGEPLVCATVRVVVPDAGVPPAFTDQQGRYALNGLAAASFVIEARQGGHTTLLYGQRTPSDVAMPVTLREGEQRLGADIVLPRDSIVTGTVVDEQGEPVEGVQVWAFQIRVEGGSAGVMSTSIPRLTDDRGQYRLTGVRPGSYVVRTLALPGALPAVEGTRAYGAVYYPGTTDAASARRVSVDGGRDAHGVDITLAPVPIGVVTGSVVHADGRPFVGRVTVSPSARSGALPIDAWTTTTDATGAFSVPNVPRGEHVIKAAEADGARHFGMQYVTVASDAPPPVRVTLAAGATVEGRIVIDGSPDLNLAGLTISVAPASADFVLPPFGALTMFAREQDGTFRATGARGPNRIVIGGTPACEACYLKSAYVDGTDAVDRPFDFGLRSGIYRGVEVTVSDGGATLQGHAVDAGAVQSLAYSVAVFPVDRTLWFARSRHVKVARSDAEGSFRVTALPPGDYLVAAVNRLEFGLTELSDTELLEQLALRAERVTLVERERKNVSLRLIRR